MNIAVTADGKNLENNVSHFNSCSYLLIINMNDLSIIPVKNEGNLKTLAEKTVEFNCEAIITGELALESFNILADNYITRFYGFGNTIKNALYLMDKNQLKLIRNLEDKDGCEGHNYNLSHIIFPD